MPPRFHRARNLIAVHQLSQPMAVQLHDNLPLLDIVRRRSAHRDAGLHASSIVAAQAKARDKINPSGESMMKKLALTILAALGAAAVPVFAHHAFAAEFDVNKPITVKGVVTKIEWNNPHAWFYVDAKTDSGAVEKWQFETGAPIELARRGWRKNDLKVGDEVTVQALRAKDGTNTASARMVTLPSGKKVFSGSAGDDQPAPPAEPQPPSNHE
jgi:hypothetical protein